MHRLGWAVDPFIPAHPPHPTVCLVWVDRHQVCLCVEHPPVQVDLVSVREEQVEVLEGLSQEEGLHHVPGPGVQRVADVADGGVAAGHLRVRLDALGWGEVRRAGRMKPVYLEDLPAPVLVRFVAWWKSCRWEQQ